MELLNSLQKHNEKYLMEMISGEYGKIRFNIDDEKITTNSLRDAYLIYQNYPNSLYKNAFIDMPNEQFNFYINISDYQQFDLIYFNVIRGINKQATIYYLKKNDYNILMKYNNNDHHKMLLLNENYELREYESKYKIKIQEINVAIDVFYSTKINLFTKEQLTKINEFDNIIKTHMEHNEYNTFINGMK